MIISGILAEVLGLETIHFACAALGLACLAYTWLATDLSIVERPIEQIESPVVRPAR